MADEREIALYDRPTDTGRISETPALAKAAVRRSAMFGSASRTRTCDLVVNSHPLYQLSYRGTYCECNPSICCAGFSSEARGACDVSQCKQNHVACAVGLSAMGEEGGCAYGAGPVDRDV